MNPSGISDPVAVARLVLTKFLQDTDDMLPAQVISYNRTTNRASVHPLIAVTTTNNKRITRAIVSSVQVLQLAGGGFNMSFPLNKGDLGWIKANDRDISLFKQFLQEAPPNTQRLHSFEDAMFIPDVMLAVIDSEDANNFVLQNTARTVKLAFWSTFMKITGRLGIGGNPDANALFDVQGTTKATKPFPRMTQGQRDAIPSPTEGMCVWNLTTHGISVYNGSVWS